MSDPTPRSEASGALLIEVNLQPIVAGARGTITMVIRNPFAQEIEIRSIEAPSSEPLLPRRTGGQGSDGEKRSMLSNLFSSMSFNFIGTGISVGPLMADLGESKGRSFYFEAKPKAKISIKESLQPRDTVHVKADEEAEVVFESGRQQPPSRSEALKIPAYQEDIAFIELRTAHWLFVTPKVLNLHAVVRYVIGGEDKSQVVPMSLTVRPPLPALIIGSVSGAILGFSARQLTSPAAGSMFTVQMIIALIGVIVMALILSIVLSRDTGTKGFVTLEDFYGAFIVGVVLGYTGTSYFDGLINRVGEATTNGSAAAAGNVIGNGT